MHRAGTERSELVRRRLGKESARAGPAPCRLPLFSGYQPRPAHGGDESAQTDCVPDLGKKYGPSVSSGTFPAWSSGLMDVKNKQKHFNITTLTIRVFCAFIISCVHFHKAKPSVFSFTVFYRGFCLHEDTYLVMKNLGSNMNFSISKKLEILKGQTFELVCRHRLYNISNHLESLMKIKDNI